MARPARTAAAVVQFLPGAIVAGRYRMIGLLGRGGMGEVYRADDMKLGQPVALKFLPADVVRDQERLDRFLSEVRVSLRVTHPNVCRVFDIGEVDGRHFLSMEYVDGEDLASLLRRIGRLPEDKAVEIARQLCAGLAAAHDEGVLHRDLKPANIMIDGRGRAKIADFGLAGATVGIEGAEARAGTPQYMAPEQVSGGALSERTDLYALGLVLYELFTGRRPYEITSFDDLQRVHSSTPTSPATHVSGLNPLVERAILRCLETDPAKRPPSADALAAALPGGDPLAMAIAAGDTPSPEMVAAAGSDAGLRPAVAWPLLGFTILGGLLYAALSADIVTARIAAPVRDPAVLVERARDVVKKAGLTSEVLDSTWGLRQDNWFLTYLDERRPVEARDTVASRGLVFWYRGSPVPFERKDIVHDDQIPSVNNYDPELRYSGEHRVFLDRDGHLFDLSVIPDATRSVGGETRVPDWSGLFDAAGLDLNGFAPATPEFTPPFFADTTVAWIPRDGSKSPMRVEAASFQGRAVSFRVVFPWTPFARTTESNRTATARVADLISTIIFTGILIGGVFVARRNLRLDRADTQGATRLALFLLLSSLAVWVIDEHHVPVIWELYLFVVAAAFALFVSAVGTTFYLAVEPYVRRTWPSILMSWSRVVAGNIRDPLVARDVLIGGAAGVAIALWEYGGGVVARVTTGTSPRFLTSVRPFLGPTHVVSELIATVSVELFFILLPLFVLLAVRLLVRRETAAILVSAVLLAVPQILGQTSSLALVPFGVISQVTRFAVLARVGLVASIAQATVSTVLATFPFVWPGSAWYSGVGAVGIVIVALLAIAAFRVATTPYAAARESARAAARA